MTLFIPLVCEDVQAMTREEYLEILAGVFTDYFHEAMSEDRFYFRFGEGVIIDTLLEEWLELDGPVKLFTGSQETVEEFLGLFDRDVMWVATSPSNQFGFTPGVVDDQGLQKYMEYFDEVTILPSENSHELGMPDTPCLSITMPKEPLDKQGEDLSEVIREFIGTITEVTGVIEPEKFFAWSDADHPIRLFITDDPSETIRSNAQDLHPQSNGKFVIYYIDPPTQDTDDEDFTTNEGDES